jgi:hypothetical protein
MEGSPCRCNNFLNRAPLLTWGFAVGRVGLEPTTEGL